MTNLFISYDLDKPGQNYAAVHKAIKSLGKWMHLQDSFFYVHTGHTQESAAAAVWAVMDRNDKLCVVRAYGASIPNATPEQINAINGVWNAQAA